MRPRSLDEILGQDHLLAPGSPLRRLAAGEAMSVFLWGPPGSGKTTIAAVVSRQADAAFVELSAVTAGVKEVRAVLDQARRDLRNGRSTVLFVDEVHRFSKTQQDVLLPAVENRLVTLIAATTENPSFSVISPLLSRSLLLTLRALTDDDVSAPAHPRPAVRPRGLAGAYTLEAEARATIVRLAGGDARRALTYLEESAAAAVAVGSDVVTTEVVAQAVDKAAVRYDRDGDQHYDVISAFIKSVRGSDVQAALHYLARMIAAGEDPRFIARRLVILASEDIGLADPTALTTAVAAAHAVQFIGMPEGRINLAQAVIALSLAPKSNAVVTAIGAAMADVAGRPDRPRPGPPAGCPLRGREGVRPWRGLPVRPRPAARNRGPAVSARRAGRCGVLPALRPWGRGGAGRAAAADQRAVGPAERTRRPRAPDELWRKYGAKQLIRRAHGLCEKRARASRGAVGG